ncbi:MAG: enoyl-CoA hydratase-related protein [Acidobacteriota bacterium]|nr:enoyl-CoA hydratase-related protein [Acidobacteriota bacterium]
MINLSIENGIATIMLNRPEKLNAFSGTMREDLLQALRQAADNSACRVVVITGAGRAFCAGGDVEFMHGLQQHRDSDAFGKLLDAGASIVMQIVEMPKPVIASINGIAAGAGCNLALACDYRIASESAKLGETFVRIGLHPDWGGTWLLPRLVGRSVAFELMATGRMVDAAEALRIGMIDRIAADLAAETRSLASAIAEAPAAVVGDIKRAFARSANNDLGAQLWLERENQLRAFLSTEAAARIAAFVEKR